MTKLQLATECEAKPCQPKTEREYWTERCMKAEAELVECRARNSELRSQMARMRERRAK